MFFQRIQYRLIFLFVLFVALILIFSGYTLLWSIRQQLETELGRKLTAVANAASVQLEETEVEYLLISPGPRIRSRLTDRLLRIQSVTGVKQIYLFDTDGTSLLDTDPAVTSNTPYFRLRFYRREMEALEAGESSYTILFEGIDGQPTMTGFSPVYLNGRVVAGIGVDGSVTFLEGVRRLRNRLYLIGLLGIGLAVILGLFMARSITTPVAKLARISRKIGRGDYSEPIPPLSRGEIRQLAQTMEEMRGSVLQRENDLKAMLAGVAHEIRNPLGGIELFTGLLLNDVNERSKAASHVRRIMKETAHLKQVVNSFLNFAKPQKPDKALYSVDTLIAESAAVLQPEIEKKSLNVLRTGAPRNLKVCADSGHMKQILINLLQNAVQATPEGGHIHIHGSEGKDGTVRIDIEDTGEGIPKDRQALIFTPFFTTRDTGTGLGLSIVKELVEINGGSLSLIRSNENGTCFRVEFPAEKEPENAAIQSQSFQNPKKPQGDSS